MISKDHLNELKAVILAAIVVLLYPVVLLITIFAFIYRHIVQLVVRKDPKARHVLSEFDACLAGRDTHTQPIAIVAPYYIFASKADKHEVMRVFTEKILKPKDNDGKCVYPELRQKLVRKYGYWFWFENDNFRLEDHIKYVNEKDPDAPMTREDIDDYIADRLLKTPFDQDRSPWEIHIVRNLDDSEIPEGKSAMIFKFNHCIFDGYSMMNFMQKVAVKPWKDLGGSPKLPKRTVWDRFWNSLILFLSGPYHVIKYTWFTNDDHNASITKSCGVLGGEMRLHKTQRVTIPACKKIRDKMNVSLTSVVFTILAETVRRTMESRNMTMSKFHITTPIFLPGHPDRLTNYWTCAKIPVSFREKDLLKTMESVNTEYRKVQNSMSPAALWKFYQFMGLLPVTLHPYPQDFSMSTFNVTNFPGPAHVVDLFGYETSRLIFDGRYCPGYQFITSVMSYREYFTMHLGADVSIFPEKEDAIAMSRTVEDIVSRLEFEIEKKFR